MGYILRGAIGFTVGGLFFTLIQTRPGSLPGGLWTSTILACAVFGMISSFALEGLKDNDRRLKTFSAIGWGIGGVTFVLLFQMLAPRLMTGTSPILVALVPAVAAGALGGAGVGFGWRGPWTAAILAIASGILLPASLWANGYIMSHAAVWLLEITPMSMPLLKVIVWALALGGFTVYGALIGLTLAIHDSKVEQADLVTAGPYVPTRRPIRPRPSAVQSGIAEALPQLPKSGYTVGALRQAGSDGRASFGVRRRGEPMADGGTAEKKASGIFTRQFRGGQRRMAEDEVMLDGDSVALTPYEEDHGAESPELAAGDVDPHVHRSGEMSTHGTFEARSRNLHPDYQGETAGGSDANRSAEDVQILRNYHPAFEQPKPPQRKHETIDVELDDGSGEFDIADDIDDDYDFLNE